MATYTPRPIDVSNVNLAEDVQLAMEDLAESAHDRWAVQRIADGWSYGPARDDRERLHPCLVPYGELPRSERDYDSLMVEGTIKSLVALGFEIARGDRNRQH